MYKQGKVYKKKIFCKNFLIFLMFMSHSNLFESNVFVKPLRKIKNFSILKAPHRFKTSQHILCFSRYEVVTSIKVYENKSYNMLELTHGQVPNFIKLINKIFIKIDSSICSQKTRTFFFKKPFFNYFLINY